MQAVSVNRTLVWGATLGVAVLATIAATSTEGQAPNQPLANGGAREWIALDRDPGGQPGLNTSKRIVLVNTSTERNAFAVNYEVEGSPGRRRVCFGTLGPGQSTICGVSARPDRGFTNGYFQVRAAQPVLPGGYRDVAVRGWEERTERVRGRVRGTGEYQFAGPAVIQQEPLDWQQGCPPKSGSGCPGAAGGGGVAQG